MGKITSINMFNINKKIDETWYFIICDIAVKIHNAHHTTFTELKKVSKNALRNLIRLPQEFEYFTSGLLLLFIYYVAVP